MTVALPLPCWVTSNRAGVSAVGNPDLGSILASHARGGASFECTLPLASVNETDPSFSTFAVNPFVFTGKTTPTRPLAGPSPNTNEFNVAASLMSKNDSNPSRVDATRTSTPEAPEPPDEAGKVTMFPAVFGAPTPLPHPNTTCRSLPGAAVTRSPPVNAAPALT